MSHPDGTRGIEQLVRDTLTDPRRRLDPPPGHYQLVGQRIGRVRRQRALRWAGSVAAVVVLIAGLGLVAGRQRGAQPGPLGQPSPSTATTGGYGHWRSLSNIGTGAAVDVVAAGTAFYVVEESPATLLVLDRVDLRVVGSTGIPDGVEALAVDPGAARIWLWYTRPDGSTLAREYATGTLAPLRDVPVGDTQVFNGVAVDGDLWLATGKGLYRIRPSDTASQPVPGFTAGVHGLALDPTRHRLVLDTPLPGTAPWGSLRMTALYPDTMAVVTGAELPLLKESIAVVSGHVWVGGYGDETQPRLYRLDPDTLQVAGTSPLNDQVGPGAILWGGDDTLWVRDGADNGVSCVNPVTGEVAAQWSANLDPIASVGRTALAVIGGTSLVQLELSDRCAG